MKTTVLIFFILVAIASIILSACSSVVAVAFVWILIAVMAGFCAWGVYNLKR